MTLFNKKPTSSSGQSPVRTDSTPTGKTHEGHLGYGRDAKSELFLLGATQFTNQDTFYEKAHDRDNRFVELVQTVTIEDPMWILNFVRWLRHSAQIRSAALVAGLEAAKAALGAGRNWQGHGITVNDQGIVRQLAKAGIGRADEPGEALAYWISQYGRNIPMPVKRAISDMVTERYTERNLLKYDTASHGFRFGDVVELTHPKPHSAQQNTLFRYAIERRHGRANGIPESLAMVYKNSLLREEALGILSEARPEILLNSNNLREAGMTWEDALSLVGSKVDKKVLWEALIPSMRYMALVRNLRNFDSAGIGHDSVMYVTNYLTDPHNVAQSRQFPLRFLNAYEAVGDSLRWNYPLEQALELSLANVPHLKGRTLVLVDTSGSMRNRFSAKGETRRWDVAALFGIALGYRAEKADIVSFSGDGWYQQRRSSSNASKLFVPRPNEAWLSAWKRWGLEDYNLNGGTDTVGALRTYLRDYHTRVVIITDEQAASGSYGSFRNPGRLDSYLDHVDSVVPSGTPLHVINVAGYREGMMPSGRANRHVYGGLTDQVFTLIPTVESGATGTWPWE